MKKWEWETPDILIALGLALLFFSLGLLFGPALHIISTLFRFSAIASFLFAFFKTSLVCQENWQDIRRWLFKS